MVKKKRGLAENCKDNENTEACHKLEIQQEILSEMKDNPPAKQILYEEQSFLLKLATDFDPNQIMAVQGKIEECLQKITSANLDLKQLQETLIGKALQQFSNKCMLEPLLTNLQKTANEVLQKLKDKAILIIFGENSIPKIEKKLENTSTIATKKEIDLSPPVNPALMTSICQEIAKLLEEVTHYKH